MSPPIAELAKEFAGRRVLITGGLGFIGSNLARTIVEGGADVRVVDALVPGHGGLRANVRGIESDIEITIGDVRNEELLCQLLKGVDTVFSLSGQTSHLDSMLDPYTDLEHNCRGPVTVLQACRQVAPDAKIVFASTRQVYGRPAYLPVDEQHPVQPVDVNGIHKAAGEAYHVLYDQLYGFRIAVLRLTNCYGPRMRVRDARQTFLGWWMRRLLTGDVLEIYGDGMQRRDFTYIDDALHAFLLSALRDQANGQPFNLGDQRSVTLRELAELLITIHGKGESALLPFPPDRERIDIGDYQGDFARIHEALGWEPVVSLEEGLTRTIDFYAENGPLYWRPGD